MTLVSFERFDLDLVYGRGTEREIEHHVVSVVAVLLHHIWTQIGRGSIGIGGIRIATGDQEYSHQIHSLHQVRFNGAGRGEKNVESS